MHPGTAVQSDHGGKRACAVGLGQIALDELPRNERARHQPLRGALKLHAPQWLRQGRRHQRIEGLEAERLEHGVDLVTARPEMTVQEGLGLVEGAEGGVVGHGWLLGSGAIGRLPLCREPLPPELPAPHGPVA